MTTSGRPAGTTPDLRQVEQGNQVDEVEEAGNESFPASDPPSWWAGED